MSDKTVSIVMATYNGSKYIEDQMMSLVRQTVSPNEIIIADDGSTDNTEEIVRAFQRTAKIKVKFLKNASRLGFRENFMHAASQATGDFIAFCDQDDIWREDKIEKCSVYFDDPSIALIVHPARTIDSASNTIGVFQQGITRTNVRAPLSYDPWGTFWGFSIMCRRDLLDLLPPENRFLDYIAPNHLIAHDRWVSFLGQMVGATAEINEYLVNYRQHESNVFGQGSGKSLSLPEDMKEKTAVYITATAQMFDIMRNMNEDVAERFPLYDKTECIGFLQRALAQVKTRYGIYSAETKLEALQLALAAAASGKYAGVNDGKFRWRSLARDLQYVAMRT